MIETIHWSAAEGLPMSTIVPTVWNALESCDELTIDYISNLLKEEYDESFVTRAYNKIDKAIKMVTAKIEWRETVEKAYKECGLTFEENGTKEVMSALSQKFDRQKMRSVFTALKELNIIRR